MKKITELYDIIEEGLEKAVMFLILSKHDDIKPYQNLMDMREAIDAAKVATRTLARGINAGKGHTELKAKVIGSMGDMLSAQGQTVIAAKHLLAMQNIVLKSFFAGDEAAGQVLKYYVSDLSQLELPQ